MNNVAEPIISELGQRLKNEIAGSTPMELANSILYTSSKARKLAKAIRTAYTLSHQLEQIINPTTVEPPKKKTVTKSPQPAELGTDWPVRN